MRRGILTCSIGVTLALAVSSWVAALSLSPEWNPYTDLYDPAVADVFEHAATVDWVEVEPRGPYRCPIESRSDWRQCADGGDASPAPFRARVIERFKGQSPQTFSLVEDAGEGTLRNLPDFRGAEPSEQAYFLARIKAIADGRHRSMRFWDIEGVGLVSVGEGFGTGIDPRMKYVVFRKGSGAITALVPVLHDDDEFLGRLRRSRANRGALIPEMSVRDFFRQASSVSLARVRSCDMQLVTGSARVDVLRGGLEPSEWVDIGLDPPSSGARYDFVPDLYRARGEKCPEGEQLLSFIIRTTNHRVEIDTDWVRASAPSIEAEPIEGATADRALDIYVDVRLPRAAVVRSGMVRLSDIPTRLRLVGPGEIPVDDVFRWSAEGAGIRGVKPVIQPATKVSVPPQTALWWPEPALVGYVLAGALAFVGAAAGMVALLRRRRR